MNARALFHRTSVAALNRLAGTPRVAYATFAMIGLHEHWRQHASEDLRFLAFCGSLRHLSHAQILQDLWVLYELDLKISGHFVEFGAYDGTVHSNTRLLEERFGWSGLLAEPNPEMAEVLRAGRTAAVDQRCVWDSTGDQVELLLTRDAELSTVAEHAAHDLHTATRIATTLDRVSVPTVSLDDLLDEHGVPTGFDFLSVDTEGTELRILRAFDVARWRPQLIAVEHNGRREQEEELDGLLGAHGYERRFRRLSDWDAWYRLQV